MRRYFFKSLLIVALLLMSRPALAAPSWTGDELLVMLFSIIAIPIGTIWFLISALFAFQKKRTNLTSLLLSSALTIYAWLPGLDESTRVYLHIFENPKALIIGVVLTVIIINFLAIFTLIKRRQAKEQEE